MPPTVTEDEIEQEFKNFGQIKPDGVFVRARKVSLSLYLVPLYMNLIGAKVEIGGCRKLESAMLLLNLKTFLAFTMHSRFEFLYY